MPARRVIRGARMRAGALSRRFELLDEVGRGGMSVVWRARDRATGRPVAVKVLAAAYADDRTLRQRMRQEGRIAAMVSSPYVVRAFDHGGHRRGRRLPFVVMELVEGGTLQQRMAAGPVPTAAAMRIGAQLAAGLVAVHEAGIVHCDVKPSNIMVSGDRAKVVDFGVAVRAGREDDLIRPDQVLGTPAYLAPERLSGGPTHPSVDVYALGILLYRLLADAFPWSVEGTTEVLAAHLSTQPAAMPFRAGIPSFVAEVARRCLAKDPAARPSGREVKSVLSWGCLVTRRAPGRHRPPGGAGGWPEVA